MQQSRRTSTEQKKPLFRSRMMPVVFVSIDVSSLYAAARQNASSIYTWHDKAAGTSYARPEFGSSWPVAATPVYGWPTIHRWSTVVSSWRGQKPLSSLRKNTAIVGYGQPWPSHSSIERAWSSGTAYGTSAVTDGASCSIVHAVLA